MCRGEEDGLGGHSGGRGHGHNPGSFHLCREKATHIGFLVEKQVGGDRERGI